MHGDYVTTIHYYYNIQLHNKKWICFLIYFIGALSTFSSQYNGKFYTLEKTLKTLQETLCFAVYANWRVAEMIRVTHQRPQLTASVTEDNNGENGALYWAVTLT